MAIADPDEERFCIFAWIFLVWAALGLMIVSAPVRAQDRKIADANITVAIETELATDQAVAGDLIDVTTKDGVVTLSGSVPHLLVHDRALEAAERTKGVRAVVDTIRVQPVERPDDEIENDVKRALFLDPAADSFEIDVAVRGARVTLTGTVDSWAERELAVEVAKGVKGVAELRNEIEVRATGQRADSEIMAEIQRRFESDPYVDDRTIEIEVDEGKVSLSGTVGSVLEKSQAGRLAWGTGVDRVNTNDLEVDWWLRDEMERPPRLTFRSDAEVVTAVKDALSYDPRISASTISVASSDNTVTLRGTVDNLKAKRDAEEDAANTTGVWKVKNRLKVRPVNPPSDAYIQRRVEESLERDAVVQQEEITALVRNQKVYLYGEVPTYYVKDRAEDVAARVFGVAAVANRIEVPARSTTKSDREIKEAIESQFFWSVYVDGGDILVEMDDGVATLRGTVDSWHELRSAVENAFQGGAAGVENELEIRSRPDIYPQRYYPKFFWSM